MPFAPQVLSVRVPDDKDGERLDRFLASAIDDLSRTRLRGLIEDGAVAGPRGLVTAPRYKVAAGEAFRISVPTERTGGAEPQAMALDILHEDDDIIVIDKPAGLVVHPAAGHPDGTLVNALLAHCGPSFAAVGGAARPGIVHRLDIGTSGVMVVAKSEAAYLALTREFAAHDIERAYEAVVWGVPSPSRGTIEANIGRSPRNRKKMAVLARDGKPAVTHYETLKRGGDALALVRCTLETGRTHQIRVHLSHIGHPIVGDPAYGRGRTKSRLSKVIGALADEIDRPLLHAVTLGIRHPRSGKKLRFSSDKPIIFKRILESFE